MRIGDYTNVNFAGNSNAAATISNLKKGDVIKAKVIEVTSDEAVLRLSDGTVIKAKTMEALNAKAGQTITLTVASKSEGTVFLETVKDTAMIDLKPDILKNLLEALKIKPDARNMELASEFLKAGIHVTANHMEMADALMKNMPGLNAEKTVFLVSNGLDTDQIQMDLLNRLLDGGLKVGQQLKDIQAILNQIMDTQGQTQASESGAEMQVRISDITTESNQTSGASSNNAENASAQATNAQIQAGNQQPSISSGDADLQEDSASRMSAADAKTRFPAGIGTQTGTAVEAGKQAGTGEEAATAAASSSETKTETVAASSSETKTETVAANATTIRPATVLESEPRETIVISAGKVESPSDTESDTSKVSTQKDSGVLNVKPAAGSISRLVEAVKDLFIRTDSDQLASELEIDRLNNSLIQRLELLQIATKYSEANSSDTGEGLSAAASAVSNTLNLINQLNANNMLYYQMPVNLSGYETTAELYIMKREQRSRRKIDAHNTVMFISLDTNNMGRIETLADVKGDTITINIRTESHRINDFIREKAKHLYSGIAACGYKLAGIRYALIDSPTTPVQQEKLLSAMLGLSHGKVDYRI